MKIQHARAWMGVMGGLLLGCSARPATHWTRFTETPSTQPAMVDIASDHYELHTSLLDPHRRRELITTLEQSYAAYCDYLGVTPAAGAPKMKCYVFATAREWAEFTLTQTGEMSSVYLQTRRGGYTVGKLFASRDAGAGDTLTVAAHEGLHLFIATHFIARPPPFLEEGIACCFESVRRDENRVSIDVGQNGARQRRLALAVDEKKLLPLRQLLAMHAGQIVGLNVIEVETFYAQAWAFARFLREGEAGRYRPALLKLISDAAAGRLSSDDLADDPAMLERYLDVKLDIIQPQYEQFVVSLAGKAAIHRLE